MSNPTSWRYFAGALSTTAIAAAAAQVGSAAPASSAAPGARTYDVREYGAKGDGATLDTAAVQSAIDACAKDKGGIVLIPAGDYVVGTVELKSNVTLHIAAAGRLSGSGNPDHYSAGKGVPPSNGNVVLLYAVGCGERHYRGARHHRRSWRQVLHRQGRQHRTRPELSAGL